MKITTLLLLLSFFMTSCIQQGTKKSEDNAELVGNEDDGLFDPKTDSNNDETIVSDKEGKISYKLI